jgi:hypothetical protein
MRRAKPIPVLSLRCEWCKELFRWHPISPSRALDNLMPRTCGNKCKGRLQGYENDLWFNSMRTGGTKVMRDFSNIQPWPNPKPLKIQRVKVAITHTDEGGKSHESEWGYGFITNSKVHPLTIVWPRA